MEEKCFSIKRKTEKEEEERLPCFLLECE